MSNRTKIIEENLNVILPRSYKNFIDDTGIITNDNGEVFGYIEGMDIDKIPCVIGATKLYKKDYKNISENEIIISFDDFENLPIVLNTKDGSVYNVDFDKKTQINSNFTEWLNQRLRELK